MGLSAVSNGWQKYLVNIAVVDSGGSSVAGRGVVIGGHGRGSGGVGGQGGGGVGSSRGSSIGGGGSGNNWGSSIGGDRGGGGGGVSGDRCSGHKSGGVSTSGGSGLGGDGVGGQGLAVALAVAVSEVASDPLRVGAAVAILGAALRAGGAASWPLESLNRGPASG